MADGTVSVAYAMPTHRPAHLGSKVTLNQEQLLQAFRLILAGKKAGALRDDNGKRIDADISFTADGSARLKTAEGVFVFAHAGLLSSDTAVRLQYLETYLNNRTIAARYAEDLRLKLAQPKLSDEEFLSIIETLSTSQESFLQAVKAKAATSGLTNSDLLQDDPRYWDNLIAPIEQSETLGNFLGNEAEAERARLLEADIRRAFFAISLSFCAPGMVPVEKFRAVDSDAMFQTLERAAALPDHFASVGAFEICADWASREARFEDLGNALLDQLFSEMNLLKERCFFFAAVFVMTLARLAQHEALKRKPPYWRRVTAAAHASLVLRACGAESAEELFRWAMQHSGKTFLFSVLLEGREEPRWRADWLTARHLIADAIGRVAAIVEKIPVDSRPEGWVDRIAKARLWLVSENAELLTALPAIGESARREAQPDEAAVSIFKTFYEDLYSYPSTDTVLMCGPGFFTIGVTARALESCRRVAEQLTKSAPRWNESNTKHVVQVLTFVAMLTQDVSLANRIAEFCVEKTRELTDDDSTLEIACRLIECASANPDKALAMTDLARRIEAVSMLALPSALTDHFDSLVHLQLLDDALSQRLSRAIASSRLGRAAA